MSDTPTTKKKQKKKKKKADPFWPIVIILSILAFTGSFWLFYSVTRNINTKTFPTTDTPKWTAPSQEPISNSGTIMIGDGNLATPTPTPEMATPTPEPTPENSNEPEPEATEAPQATPKATPTPVATAAPTPKPSRAATPEPTSAPSDVVKQIAYRVQAGSFSSQEEAQETVSKLTAQGYNPSLITEGDKFIIQLGTFEEQDKALALAEEVIQRRFNVSVRRIER